MTAWSTAASCPPTWWPGWPALGVTVVTQPAFVHDRGDRYLAEVEPDDLPHLYRCASLEDAGVPVGGSTDAPFGPDDPWLAMRTAVARRTRSGADVRARGAVPPAAGPRAFPAAPAGPGGPPRTVAVGAPADLGGPRLHGRGLADLDAGHVVATVAAGAAGPRAVTGRGGMTPFGVVCQNRVDRGAGPGRGSARWTSTTW